MDESNAYHKAQDVAIGYGDSHLLGPNVRIPSHLFVRRAFVIETAKDEPLPSTASLCIDLPTSECFDIPIKALHNEMEEDGESQST